MMKIKPFLLLTAVLVLVLALSACGGQNAPANAAPQEQANVAGSENEMKDAVPEDPAGEETAPQEPAPQEPANEEPAVEQPADTAGISFSAEIQPILESRCINCHGGERIEGELVMFTHGDLMAGGESGPVIIPGDADASYLAELILDQKMPKRGPKLTPVQTQLIIDWINQGALDN